MTLIIVASIACAAQVPGPETTHCSDTAQTSASEVFAFAPKGNRKEINATCSDISPQSLCSQLQLPKSMSYGLLICTCSGADRSVLQVGTTEFSKRFSLFPMEVAQVGVGWIVKTREVKLLCSSAERRKEILANLSHTRFALSPEDRESPYRLIVRRRDGHAPSPNDISDLKALGVDVEIETINIFRKGTDIQP